MESSQDRGMKKTAAGLSPGTPVYLGGETAVQTYSPDRSVARPEKSKGIRGGMVAKGAYPEVSRSKLARELGKHVSTVSFYLSGRIQMPLEVAGEVARLVGVTLEELSWTMGRERAKWKGRKATVMKRKGK